MPVVRLYGHDQHPVVTMEPLADVDSMPSPYCVPPNVHALDGRANVALGMIVPETMSYTSINTGAVTEESSGDTPDPTRRTSMYRAADEGVEVGVGRLLPVEEGLADWLGVPVDALVPLGVAVDTLVAEGLPELDGVAVWEEDPVDEKEEPVDGDPSVLVEALAVMDAVTEEEIDAVAGEVGDTGGVRDAVDEPDAVDTGVRVAYGDGVVAMPPSAPPGYIATDLKSAPADACATAVHVVVEGV